MRDEADFRVQVCAPTCRRVENTSGSGPAERGRLRGLLHSGRPPSRLSPRAPVQRAAGASRRKAAHWSPGPPRPGPCSCSRQQRSRAKMPGRVARERWSGLISLAGQRQVCLVPAVLLAFPHCRLEVSDTASRLDRPLRGGLPRSEFWCVLPCTGRFTTSAGMNRDRDGVIAGMDSWVWQRALSLNHSPVSSDLRI